ncbi:hypothetical protein FB645_003495 [Coemansia sp. IMI 203386]|nr:hypothetical protein FB645_003495 [Coemansia sp. IMI 203386]
MSLSFYPLRTSKWKVPVTANGLGPSAQKKVASPEAVPLPLLRQSTVADLGPHFPQSILIDSCPTDDDSMDTDNFQALQARELLKSLRSRHQQLARFLQQFNEFKMNPLCGAMCADLEDKIHQMALLIRSQQVQLKDMVDAYDQRLERSTSTGSSMVEWEEEMKAPQPLEKLDAPVTNWLATIRVSVLKEVIDFSANELQRIEASSLLAKCPTQLHRRPPSLSARSFASSASSSSSASSFSAFM